MKGPKKFLGGPWPPLRNATVHGGLFDGGLISKNDCLGGGLFEDLRYLKNIFDVMMPVILAQFPKMGPILRLPD